MLQNTGFNFTEAPPSPLPDVEFKKEREAYLAQRNARKQQAKMQLKQNYGRSSSSDSDSGVGKKAPVALRSNVKHIRGEDKNTDSSKNSIEHDSEFKRERQKYKAERVTRRQEMLKNKKKQFGSSSSDDQSVPVRPMAVITEPVVQSALKIDTSPKQRVYRDQPDTLSLSSLDLQRSKHPKGNQLVSVKLKTENGDKKSSRERYQVEVPSKKGVNIWIEQWMQFRQNAVELNGRSIAIYQMNKMKLLFTRTAGGCLKAKITVKEQEIFFAVNHKKINQLCLDHYYFVFARVVMLKLQIMGKKPTDRLNKDKLGLSQQLLKGAKISGKVRKSSFFGGWEEKIGVINTSGLSIYRQGKEKASMVIAFGSIKQLWTRFDFDNQNLIIKFLNSSSKIQLSIPVQNYLNRDNWLYHLYSLAAK